LYDELRQSLNRGLFGWKLRFNLNLRLERRCGRRGSDGRDEELAIQSKVNGNTSILRERGIVLLSECSWIK
jgi:hypothetical protein